MKMNSGSVQGSMGIPPQIQEAAERARASREQNVKKPEPAKDEEARPFAETPPPLTDDIVKESSPLETLKELGIEFNDELFQNLLFKGYIESVVEIIKGRFNVKFKTLTTDEYDLVDELLAQDVRDIQMTNEGFNSRRAMWIIAFGVTELHGKAVCKPVLDKDKKFDLIETTKMKRKVLGKMSPSVINPIIQKHGAMTVAINMISSSPEEYIKNS